MRAASPLAFVIVVLANLLAITELSAEQRFIQEDKEAEFIRLAHQWENIDDLEHRLQLLERVSHLELELSQWPLDTPRDEFKGTILRALADTYRTRREGLKADNIDKAISAYELAVTIYQPQKFPAIWANLQHNLALTYTDRIVGDRAENLESAIAAHEKALTLQTRYFLPKEWAQTQYYLGNRLVDRIRGDRSINIERAIEAYNAALTVQTFETSPEAWAKTQNNLAAAYMDRLLGNRSDNVEQGIKLYQAALRVFTFEGFPHFWGWTHVNLGNGYRRRTRGDRASNIDEAIKLYTAALTLFRPDQFAEDWAWTNTHLGDAYAERVAGDPADNLDRAIGAYHAALIVYTRAAFPKDFAAAQTNLGNVYVRRIHEEPAKNIELATKAYDEALSVHTREGDPKKWANIQYERGISYFARTTGDRAANLEQAISAFEETLNVWTKDYSPEQWAKVQNNLGAAYRSRVRGDHADNIERAIVAYQAALTQITPGNSSWAGIQHNLAIAYESRVRGEASDNIERSIRVLEAAFSVFSRDANSEDWANAKLSLANAYARRVYGDKSSNLTQAIEYYQEALTVFTQESFPQEWARGMINIGAVAKLKGNVELSIKAYKAALKVYTREAFPERWADLQDKLGNAFGDRKRGDRTANEELALAAFDAALSIRTREAFPRDWAATQHNMANVLSAYKGADNREKAIDAYLKALTMFTADAFPRDHLRSARFLGQLFFAKRDWASARQTYESARKSFLLLFGQGLNETEARDLIESAGPIFAEAAYAAAEMEDASGALNLLSEGKAQLLAVALRQRGLELPPEVEARYNALRSEIRELSRVTEIARGTEGEELLQRLVARRAEFGNLLQQARVKGSSTGGVMALVRALIPAGGAIVAPIVTGLGGKIVIVTATNENVLFSVVDLPDLTNERLRKLLRGDAKDGSGGWFKAYRLQYLPSQEQISRIGEWRRAIEDIGPTLWTLFAARLDSELQHLGVKAGARLIWLPTGGLGLLPLNLARDRISGRQFIETYEIVYAPSLEALNSASHLLAQVSVSSLAAAVNPAGNIPKLNLPFAEIEGALVASHFRGKSMITLDKSSATPTAVLAALNGKSYWHFSSHGFFDWTDARKTGLRMKDGAPLSVGSLLEAEGIANRPRLVAMSACETGLYDVRLNPDEFVGLPSTFMQLGAAGVLSTLWQVDDLATAMLMAKFYELHLDRNLPPPTALRQAQAWLRTASKADLINFVRASASYARLDSSMLADIEGSLKSRSRSGTRGSFWNMLQGFAVKVQKQFHSYPFAHPYYWGGFVYTGL